MARVAAHQADLDIRDDLIRKYLREGVTYKELIADTGLSRPQLDKIRRGSRTT